MKRHEAAPIGVKQDQVVELPVTVEKYTAVGVQIAYA